MGSRLHLLARMPFDPEEASINGASLTQPQWYQFKPRSLLLTPWLSGMGEGFEQPRKRLILADEGGMGKSKAAALLMHQVFTSNPHLPILVLVQPRQVKSWRAEVRSVSRAPTYVHRNWPRRFTAGIHIVSKFAYQAAAQRLEGEASMSDLLFSLIVLDEAHMHKLAVGDSNDQQHSTVFAKREQELCSQATDRVLGITATPMGLNEAELHDLAEKLGIPANLRSTEEQWQDWTRLCDSGGDFLERRRQLATATAPNQTDWNNFVDRFGERLAEVLPLPESVDRQAFFIRLRDVTFDSIDSMQALLADLTPTASYMSVMLRSHLGQDEASNLFRKMHVANPWLGEACDDLVRDI